MGLFSSIGDLLFGTEGDAQRANQAQMQQALSLLGSVPVQQLFEMARGQVTGKSGEMLSKDFQSAIGLVGSAGAGAQLGVQRGATQALGDVRTNLLQRGLSGSSLLGNAQAGIRGRAALDQGAIAGNVAGQQAGLVAGRGQALAADQRAREALLASLFTGEAASRLGQAQAQAGVLQSYQHRGTQGLIGPLLGAAAGGFGGGLGLLAGNWASGGLLEKIGTSQGT